jgi:ubiquinone/menaquinone biosynthesis C-methylase UbiE
MSVAISSSKDQFDRQAKHYDGEWNSWSQHILDWMLAAAAPKDSDILLDVATGTGFTALAFSPEVKSVIGVDVSSGMLQQAQAKADALDATNVKFIQAPAEKLPFAGSMFDIIVCRLASHHFVNILDFIAEAHRLLRPAGRLIIADTTVPEKDFIAATWQNDLERLRDRSHWKNYSAKEWRVLLRSQDFEIVSIENAGEGIRIPLQSWVEKAGCTDEQVDEVRRRFTDAPSNAARAFKIDIENNGGISFSWMRVSILAVKPGR